MDPVRELQDGLPPPRITARGLALLVLVHLALALCYAWIVTYFDTRERIPLAETLPRALIDHGSKVLLSLPAWWIAVRLLDRRGWTLRLLAHGLILPLYAWSWNAAYHWGVTASGALGVYEPAILWDAYRTVFTYVAQFAVIHLVREHARIRHADRLAGHLRDLALQSELRALRGQVMPHFLFNTLHSLAAAVPGRYEEFRSRIAQLGSLLRYTLSASEQDLVTLREELDFARDYLSLEQKRLGNRLELHFEVDESALAAPVPPVLLQPLIENALKHGVAEHRDGGSVELRIRRDSGQAVVAVRNRVRGERHPNRQATGSGVGLRSCSARLRGALGSRASLQAQPLGDGFEVEVRVPCPELP